MKFINSILVVIVSILFSCTSDTETKKNIVDVILNDTSSYFYLDTAGYPTQDKTLPIGVFDSGTGGLTVLEAIVNYDKNNNNHSTKLNGGDGLSDFQNEYFIYLGDMANMPYGEYSSHNKTELLKEHIIKDVQFLLSSKYYISAEALKFSNNKSPIKALVIACNTATAYGKDDIEKFLANAGIKMKVIGVIGAGVRGALSTIKKNEDVSIGVLATYGTVCSNGYLNELIDSYEKFGYTGTLKIFQQAGIGWAGAIDGAMDYISREIEFPRQNYRGPSLTNMDALIDTAILARYNFDWTKNKMLYDGTTSNPSNLQINSIDNYTSYHVVSLLEQIIKNNNTPKLKSIILGCTHYPFYIDQIRNKLSELYNYKENGKYVYRDVMVENINLVDPAENTSYELYDYLKSYGMFNEADLSNSEFYISVANKDNPNNILSDYGDFEYEYKYGRDAKNIQEYVKRVPFSKSILGNDAIEMLSDKAPITFGLIKNFVNYNPKTSALPETEKLN